jgi:hypothetical protein
VSKKTAKKKRGPVEDRLKINGDWKAAMAVATNKPKPKSGWPEK